MTAVTEEILLDRIKSGRLIEDSSQATERYIEGLKRTLIVSADTELISAPAYMNATKDFSTLPSISNYITVMGIVQDELGHAHIAYRMLRDLGVDTEIVYERKPPAVQAPLRLRRAAGELHGAHRRQRLLRQGRLRLLATSTTTVPMGRGSGRSSRWTARRTSTSGTARSG